MRKVRSIENGLNRRGGQAAWRWQALWAAAAVVLAGGAAFALWLAGQRMTPDLLARARVIVPGWRVLPAAAQGGGVVHLVTNDTLAFDIETGGYAWRTNDMLLAWRGVENGRVHAGWRLIQINARTGARTSLMAFNRRVGARHQLSAEWRVSPNGRRMVWPNVQNDKTGWPQRVSWTLATLDGSHVRQIPAGGTPAGAQNASRYGLLFAPFAWQPDNRGWSTLISDLPYLGVRAYNPATSPPFHDTLIGSAVGNPPTLPAPHPRELLGFTNGRGIGASWSEWGTNVFEFGVHSPPNMGPADVRRFAVKLPPGAFVDGAALSPNGEQIAWALRRERTPRTLIDRLLFWIPKADPRAGLYVTRRDGTHGHILGWVRVGPRKSNEPPTSDDGLVHLRWTPDGRRLSWVHRGALCVLPIRNAE